MSNILDKLNWRYATKKFDSSKKLSLENLNTLLEAIKLSASSYGLQPYHIFVIEDKDIREKLKPASWGQSQITDASQIIVFANKTTVNEELVDDYINNLVTTRGIAQKDLKGFSDFMKSKLVQLTNTEKEVWAANQVYLALGNVMTIAAELEIDTCPMEGFEPEQYNEILGLNEKQLNAAVVLAVGYRSEDDQTQHDAKVRRAKEKLFTHI